MLDRGLERGDRWLGARSVGVLAILASLGLVCGSACQPRSGPGQDEVQGGRRTGSGTADGASSRAAVKRAQMIDQLRSVIQDERVLEAMSRVPRHEFVDERYQARAYDPHSPLPIDENQTISAPDVVAIMTASLRLKGDEKVLEIGTGSGYQAAVLGELVKEVYSLEIRPSLAQTARRRLEDLRARGLLSYEKIEVIAGNGYQGYPEAAPFDAVIVTAAPKELPVELLNQLRRGGRMVIPVGDFYQELQVITKNEDGQLSQEKVLPVRFVPMVHEAEAGPRD